MQQVVDALAPHGLTLQNYASISEQQLGGFLQVRGLLNLHLCSAWYDTSSDVAAGRHNLLEKFGIVLHPFNI